MKNGLQLKGLAFIVVDPQQNVCYNVEGVAHLAMPAAYQGGIPLAIGTVEAAQKLLRARVDRQMSLRM